MIVEGTYPFVAGGVSSWVHDIVQGLPELTFDMVNIGSHPGSYGEPRFQLGPNVRSLNVLFCRENDRAEPLRGPARRAVARRIRAVRRRPIDEVPSRTLRGLRRLHLDDLVSMTSSLRISGLAISTSLRFSMVARASTCSWRSTSVSRHVDPSFLDLFWHFRAMHMPMLRLLAVPPAASGLLSRGGDRVRRVATGSGVESSKRPAVLGDRARHPWRASARSEHSPAPNGFRDDGEDDGLAGWAPAASALRQLWSRMFRKLSRVAYYQAARIVTLSEANRQKEIVDGAPADKIQIVPNGVRLAPLAHTLAIPSPVLVQVRQCIRDTLALSVPPLRVGFVGRVVPIKDVVRFIKGCDLA